jgi:hypothetical protein
LVFHRLQDAAITASCEVSSAMDSHESDPELMTIWSIRMNAAK